jgi:hypothetical protein
MKKRKTFPREGWRLNESIKTERTISKMTGKWRCSGVISALPSVHLILPKMKKVRD